MCALAVARTTGYGDGMYCRAALAAALTVTVPASAALPPASDRAAWRELLAWPDRCERDVPKGIGSGIDIDRVGARRLVTVTCSLGAYQGRVRMYVVNAAGTPTLLRFRDPEESPDGGLRSVVRAEIVGTVTVGPRGRIAVLQRLRGVGGCGILSVHELAGRNTRLVSVRARLTCDETAPPPGRWPGVPLSEIPRV